MKLIHPIEYDYPDTSSCASSIVRPSRKSKSNVNSICVVIMAILLSMVLWNMQRISYGSGSGRMYDMPHMVSGMYSRLRRGKGVSARQASASSATSGDAFLSAETQAAIKACGDKVACPTTCPKGDKCESYKDMTDTDKTGYDAAVLSTIKDAPGSLLMIWAPWCPHCHNAIPMVIEAAKKLANKKKVILVNAEMCSSKLLQGGEGSIAKVTHFPFITKDEELYKGPMQPDAIAAFASGDQAGPPTKDDVLNSYF